MENISSIVVVFSKRKTMLTIRKLSTAKIKYSLISRFHFKVDLMRCLIKEKEGVCLIFLKDLMSKRPNSTNYFSIYC